MANEELIVHIGGDVSPLNAAVKEMLSSTQKAMNEIKKLMKGPAEETVKTTKTMTSSWGTALGVMKSALIAFGVYFSIQFLTRTIIGGFKRGMESVDSFKLSVAAVAGTLASLSKSTTAAEIAGKFKMAYSYASDLIPKLEAMTSQTLMTGKELSKMAEQMAIYGITLDINNKKQVEGFIATANAIAIMTQGMNREVQVRQEIRSLAQGQARAVDQLGRFLKAIYGTDLPKLTAEWKRSGVFLEKMGESFSGFLIASSELQNTWMVVKNLFETVVNKIFRQGFWEFYTKSVVWAKEFLSASMDAKGNLQGWAKSLADALSSLISVFSWAVKIGVEIGKWIGYLKTFTGFLKEIGGKFKFSDIFPGIGMVEKFGSAIKDVVKNATGLTKLEAEAAKWSEQMGKNEVKWKEWNEDVRQAALNTSVWFESIQAKNKAMKEGLIVQDKETKQYKLTDAGIRKYIDTTKEWKTALEKLHEEMLTPKEKLDEQLKIYLDLAETNKATTAETTKIWTWYYGELEKLGKKDVEERKKLEKEFSETVNKSRVSDFEHELYLIDEKYAAYEEMYGNLIGMEEAYQAEREAVGNKETKRIFDDWIKEVDEREKLLDEWTNYMEFSTEEEYQIKKQALDDWLLAVETTVGAAQEDYNHYYQAIASITKEYTDKINEEEENRLKEARKAYDDFYDGIMDDVVEMFDAITGSGEDLENWMEDWTDRLGGYFKKLVLTMVVAWALGISDMEKISSGNKMFDLLMGKVFGVNFGGMLTQQLATQAAGGVLGQGGTGGGGISSLFGGGFGALSNVWNVISGTAGWGAAGGAADMAAEGFWGNFPGGMRGGMPILAGAGGLLTGLMTGNWAVGGGQAAGGIGGALLGNMILPGLGGILGAILGSAGGGFLGGLFGGQDPEEYRAPRRAGFWAGELGTMAQAPDWESMLGTMTTYPTYWPLRTQADQYTATGNWPAYRESLAPFDINQPRMDIAGLEFTGLEEAGVTLEQYTETFGKWDNMVVDVIKTLDDSKTATVASAEALGEYDDVIKQLNEDMPGWGEEAQQAAEAMIQLYENMKKMIIEDVFDKYVEGTGEWGDVLQTLTELGLTPLESATAQVELSMKALLETAEIGSDIFFDLYGRLQDGTKAVGEYNGMMEDMNAIQEILVSGYALSEEQLVKLITYYRAIKLVLDGDISAWDALKQAQEEAIGVIDEVTVALSAEDIAAQKLADTIAGLVAEIAGLNARLEIAYQRLSALQTLQAGVAGNIREVTVSQMTGQQYYEFAQNEMWGEGGTVKKWQQAYQFGTPEEQYAALDALQASIMTQWAAGVAYIEEAFNTQMAAEEELYNANMEYLTAELDLAIQLRDELNAQIADQEALLALYQENRGTFTTNIDQMIEDMRLSAMTPADRFNELRNEILMTSMAGLGAMEPEERLAAIQDILANWQELQQLAVSIYGEGAGKALAATEEVIAGLEDLRVEGLDAYDQLIANTQTQIDYLTEQRDLQQQLVDMATGAIDSEQKRHDAAVIALDTARNEQLAALNTNVLSWLTTVQGMVVIMTTGVNQTIADLQQQIIDLQEDLDDLLNPPEEEPKDEGTMQVGGVIPRTGRYKMEAGETVFPVSGGKPLGVNLGGGEVQVYVLPLFYRNVDKRTIEKYVREDVLPCLERESKVRGKKLINSQAIRKSYRGI